MMDAYAVRGREIGPEQGRGGVLRSPERIVLALVQIALEPRVNVTASPDVLPSSGSWVREN
jgi:hypothetical protein